MRRWLSILLLVFMPLQSSWAAVATYSELGASTLATHFGHHEHEHKHELNHPSQDRQPAGESSEASKAKPVGASVGASEGAFDAADCHSHSHSHCQCAAGLPGPPVMPMVIGSPPLTDWTMADAIAPVLSRPERPQWVDHA